MENITVRDLFHAAALIGIMVDEGIEHDEEMWPWHADVLAKKAAVYGDALLMCIAGSEPQKAVIPKCDVHAQPRKNDHAIGSPACQAADRHDDDRRGFKG